MAVKKTIAKKPIKKKARKPKKKVWKESDPNKPLTPRQKLFVFYYIANLGSGAEAIRQAKFETKNPRNYASELLTKPYIQNYYNEQLQIAFANGGIMVNKSMMNLARMANSNILDFYDVNRGEVKPLIDELPREQTGVIQSIESEIRFLDNEGNEVSESSKDKDIISQKNKIKLYDSQKANIKILEMAGKFPNFGNAKNDQSGTGSEEKAIESIKKLIEFQEKITNDTNLKENQTVSEAEKC